MPWYIPRYDLLGTLVPSGLKMVLILDHIDIVIMFFTHMVLYVALGY